ncbi:MAG: hypothetical protein RL563_518 [Pseudomonadota bacterium]|jgi:hypothetical protein
MLANNWNVVFLNLGHYVASRNTRYGELIVLCSDSEKIPSRRAMEIEREAHRSFLLNGHRLKPARSRAKKHRLDP